MTAFLILLQCDYDCNFTSYIVSSTSELMRDGQKEDQFHQGIERLLKAQNLQCNAKAGKANSKVRQYASILISETCEEDANQ
jgi:hypothetical protein